MTSCSLAVVTMRVGNPFWKSIKTEFKWGDWESEKFVQCGVLIEQNSDSSFSLVSAEVRRRPEVYQSPSKHQVWSSGSHWWLGEDPTSSTSRRSFLACAAGGSTLCGWCGFPPCRRSTRAPLTPSTGPTNFWITWNLWKTTGWRFIPFQRKNWLPLSGWMRARRIVPMDPAHRASWSAYSLQGLTGGDGQTRFHGGVALSEDWEEVPQSRSSRGHSSSEWRGCSFLCPFPTSRNARKHSGRPSHQPDREWDQRMPGDGLQERLWQVGDRDFQHPRSRKKNWHRDVSSQASSRTESSTDQVGSTARHSCPTDWPSH